MSKTLICTSFCCLLAFGNQPSWAQQEPLQHDAEHYILLQQHAKTWSQEDRAINAKLAEVRANSNGKSPNIVYILLDDLGFGEIGMPSLDVIRGYSTPRISNLARQGLTFSRMYTEPTGTPTRAAMMTGRYAVRTGTSEAKSVVSGEGLNAWEVTLAEVLSQAGYATFHIGKWHLGDIEESYAFNQGFDTQDHYNRMEEGYKNSVLEQLERLSKGDRPFFLQYWPQHPLSFTRSDIKQAKTLNGGPIAESIVKVDGWIGEIVDTIDELGIGDNTIVMVMGDNGPFMQYVDRSGQSDRIYRGGKVQHLEGGVRVNAFMRWPAVLKGGIQVQDIVHVTDLFTTFARVAGADKFIPRGRLIDGVDQSPLLFFGETYGRRDYVFVYEGPTLKSIVKQQYKFHLPPPGSNPIAAPVFDLYKNPREDRPQDAIQHGVGFGAKFVQMLKRHMAMKQQYPDREPGRGVPYRGIENLRPETKALVESMSAWMKPKQ